MKQYSKFGFVGCVQQRRSQETGTLISVYNCDQAVQS